MTISAMHREVMRTLTEEWGLDWEPGGKSVPVTARIEADRNTQSMVAEVTLRRRPARALTILLERAGLDPDNMISAIVTADPDEVRVSGERYRIDAAGHIVISHYDDEPVIESFEVVFKADYLQEGA